MKAAYLILRMLSLMFMWLPIAGIVCRCSFQLRNFAKGVNKTQRPAFVLGGARVLRDSSPESWRAIYENQTIKLKPGGQHSRISSWSCCRHEQKGKLKGKD